MEATSTLACDIFRVWRCWGTLAKKRPFLLQILASLWDIILTSLLPTIQSCSSKFWEWSYILLFYIRGGVKIMDGRFKPKYGTVSQYVQLVVASALCTSSRIIVTIAPTKFLGRARKYCLITWGKSGCCLWVLFLTCPTGKWSFLGKSE